MPSTNPPVSVRVRPDERHLLEAAARQVNVSLSDFIRRKAIEGAELELLDRRVVTIAAADWDRFEAWAREPAKSVPALRDLAATRPTWQD